jgi:hypothetical protein
VAYLLAEFLVIGVVPYRPEHREAWDGFVQGAKNGHFLFERAYLEYHADRFEDASLMLFDRDRLAAVLPADRRDTTVGSHRGLTFGGLVTDERMTAERMLGCFAAVLGHLREEGITELIYKALPHIYHRVPAEEDLYALFRFGARLIRRDVSSTIRTGARPRPAKGRRWSLGRSRSNGIAVGPSDDFETFMAIEEELLLARYGKKPVHTAAEMRLLAGRFPENIRLFAAHRDGAMLAGVILYETAEVCHCQYIAANDEGKRLSALDAVLSFLIEEHCADRRYFDFGISTEQDGRYLNAGLIANKESYGARATVCDVYALDSSAVGAS